MAARSEAGAFVRGVTHMPRSSRLLTLLCLVGFSAVYSRDSSAASFTWDSAPSTAGITDGSGTWSTVVTNTTWWNGTSNVAWATNSSDTPVFGSGGAASNPSTVTVSGSVRAGGIAFGSISTGRWVIQSGTIGLTDGAVVSFETGWNPGNTAYRIDSVLIGSNVTFRQNQSPLNGTQFNVNGANTLTGTTTIDGVFIQATMVGMGGGGAIDIKQNSMIDFTGTGTVSSPLTITGTGVGGRGVIRMATSTGGTNQTLSGPITLAGDAMIAVGGLAGAVISGPIGETAGGLKNLRFSTVSGTVQLRGASTYSGTTTISGGNGAVVLDGGDDRLPAATILVTENSNMKLVLGGTFGGAMSQTFAGFGAINNTTGVVGGAAGMSTFVASISSGASTYAGMIGGGGANENNIAFSKTGSGRLTLTGTSYTYTGNTTISGGTLALGLSAAALASSPVVRVGSAGSSGAVFDLTARSGTYTFGSNQTVAGIGTINFGAGKTVASQGIWAPGNSIGSNAVTGNLTLSGTSQFELGTPGASQSLPGLSDYTAVSGTLTLGGELQLIDNADADGNGSMAAGSYRIFTYGNTVTGSFSSVTNPLSTTTRTSVVTAGSGTAAGSGVFVNVYNLASAASLSGTVNLGTVLTGTPLSKALSIVNTAPAGSYSEKLDAAFGTLSGGATGTGSVSLLAAGGTNASSMLVGLPSGSAGAMSGSAQVTFASNGDGTSGYGSLALAPQTVSLTGTVLDPSLASFASGTTQTSRTLSFGTVNQGDTVAPLGFDLWNLVQTAGYTADLELLSITSSGTNGPFSTNLVTFAALESGSFNSYQTFVSTADQGTFSNTWTLVFRSTDNGGAFAGESQQTLTLAANVIVVPEPGAVALAGIGIVAALWGLRRRTSDA
jgi:autotransporter-associated beta strand protein